MKQICFPDDDDKKKMKLEYMMKKIIKAEKMRGCTGKEKNNFSL